VKVALVSAIMRRDCGVLETGTSAPGEDERDRGGLQLEAEECVEDGVEERGERDVSIS